ncbi:MAG: 23S rRNA (adenine(2503)-C(2))-methyltransferase RlmN [Myxococcales bacterium]|nr:23S rRNA (adenine(2503)-C(2))-methyltransferase RlmN [Myxococcales bacterium]
MPDAPDLLGLPLPALGEWLEGIGVGRKHAPRLFRGMHHDRLAVHEIPDLGRHAATITAHMGSEPLAVASRHPSPDGSTRLLFALRDGARVEGVLLPNKGNDRVTLCVSTQVGCAMACAFCATGTLGLARDLSSAEIVGQVHAARAELQGTGRRLTRLVFMGMGEPLHAYVPVRDALKVLLDGHGEPFAARSVTVSTVGLVDRLRRLGEDFGGRIQLAISLHAGTDETRRRLLPAARHTSLEQLRDAILAMPRPGDRALMLEVVLLPGVNDGEAEWDGIARFADGMNAVVNVIPFNPFPGSSFRPPTDDEIERAWRALRERGVANKVRWPRGRAVDGACGQLVASVG